MYAKNPLTYLIAFLFLIILATNLYVKTEQHFVLLARSFLNHKLIIPPTNNNISDLALYQGKYFWPLGPFPAIMLIPFVVLINPFYQGYISFPLSLLNFFLLYKIARHHSKLDHQKSLLAATFFIFGSIYTALAALPASWYFAQTVACSLLIFALFEFLNKKRYFLIGTYIALSVATRLNLILSSIFFLYFLAKKPFNLKNFIKFVNPIIFTLFFIAGYNYVRFHNPFESGYNFQLIPQQATDRRAVGLFSIEHIPSNLFYMLLKGPDPVLNSAHELKPPFVSFDSYGLSLFFLSPVLFLIFKADFKKEIVKASFTTIAIMLIPLLTYYGIGHRQVGFRYALDFFPFVFLIVADAMRSVKIKILYPLILFGVFFSTYFTLLYLFSLQTN